MESYIKQLKHSEEDSLKALNKIALVSITDTQGTIFYVNDKFVEISKYSREELIGQNHRILKSGDQPQELFFNLWKTISQGRIWHGEVKNRSKDGSYYWVDVSVTPLCDQSGIPEKYIALGFLVNEKTKINDDLQQKVTDLENAKKAMLNLLEDIEEAKARDEAILLGIGDSLITTDKNATILFVNDVFCDVLGWTQQEVVGKNFTEVIPLFHENGTVIADNERPILKTLKEKRKVSSPVPSTFCYATKDKKLIPVTITVSPIIIEGEVVGAVELFHDITKEKQIDKVKTEFVSLASHQLRTPLSSINWYAEMLLAGDAGELNEEQRKYLTEVYRGNQRMVSLVNALLNASRLDLGTFIIEPKPCDLVQISKSVVAELRSDSLSRNVSLEEIYDTDLSDVNVDPNLVRIILQNLLSNALKYTPSGGHVEISLRHESKGKNILSRILEQPSILITVSDTGYGIPDSQKDKIFTKLFRADNIRDYDTEGSGLGLYIAKSILEESGGDIWFESIENKGTIFCVLLPEEGMKKKEGTRSLG